MEEVDLNDFGFRECEASPGQILGGFDDWANLAYDFTQSGNFSPGAPSFEPTPDLTAEEAREQIRISPTLDSDGDGIPNGSDPCPDSPAPTCATQVSIDIQPNDDTNTIKPGRKGSITVAILGSTTFDVTDVNVTTLAFGPSGAPPTHDLTTSSAATKHRKDANADGFLDLLSHYRTQETGIAVGDTSACLTWETLDGSIFESCDDVSTEKKGGGQGKP